MKASAEVGAPDGTPPSREAVLRWSHGGRRWYAYPGGQQVWGTLLVLPPIGCFALSAHFLGETGEAFLVGLPFALTCLILPLWVIWSYLPKKHRRQQREELTRALAEKLTGVRFKDGSVSDFSPTGGVLLTYGTALAFDAPRLLGRLVERPGDSRLTEIDWIWSLEDFARFEVRDVPVKGLWQRLRKSLGAEPRTRIALSAFAHDGNTTVDWPIAPGYEAAARKIAAALNRKLAP